MLKRKYINLFFIALLVTLIGLNFVTAIPWISYPVILILWFLLTLCGSFFIRWNYHLTSLSENKNVIESQISLTFDDGPNPEFTPKILELLEQYNAKATFFLIGKHAEKHPNIVQNILRQGHSIGNHTYSHTNDFGFFRTNKVINELRTTNTIVEKISGYKMRLYRPAFGVTNPSIQEAVTKLNVSSIGWSVRSLDTTNRSEEVILKRITAKVTKGDIILLHDTSTKTVDVLERLLLFLQVNNLKSVPVEQLLKIKAYE
ncbi:polysaccharide deacetylase family protein [Aurantibacter crassamenti]|uniref:polysaccharide deacetylase family protein n=1 Tax=Aurantibacter crassamenti TaxID=1837375 RepID=UPI00193A6761|nr:polysaccharide deacetylase family protein [Aurantibacter crassamenti]MBM1105515.1 polysaccharide deacetylase family protein [Aurantibacter crassamenti]